METIIHYMQTGLDQAQTSPGWIAQTEGRLEPLPGHIQVPQQATAPSESWPQFPQTNLKRRRLCAGRGEGRNKDTEALQGWIPKEFARKLQNTFWARNFPHSFSTPSNHWHWITEQEGASEVTEFNLHILNTRKKSPEMLNDFFKVMAWSRLPELLTVHYSLQLDWTSKRHSLVNTELWWNPAEKNNNVIKYSKEHSTGWLCPSSQPGEMWLVLSFPKKVHIPFFSKQ